ncbi:mitochondrial ribonuclease P catalytic subunit-like [Artemia franciscana]|uniref:PRORP domain-containing protein n=1 Tax=Artemia franciscana TaxID=6661 RepID=A0AA88LFD7_ARTSF|nr:hypothetical protein QYM36_001231 [Artemia franciscana]
MFKVFLALRKGISVLPECANSLHTSIVQNNYRFKEKALQILNDSQIDSTRKIESLKTVLNLKNDSPAFKIAFENGKAELVTEFMKKKNETSNVSDAEMLIYLRYVPKYLDVVDQKLVTTFIDRILGMEFVPDSALYDVIHGLSGTKEWQKGISLYNQLKNPSKNCLENLIIASVNSWDFDTCFRLLKQLCISYSTISDHILETLVESKVFETLNKTGKYHLKLFISLLAENEIYPSNNVTKKLERQLVSNGYTVNRFLFKRHGKCPKCSTQFQVQTPLTFREYSRLKGAVMKNVLVGNDVFQRSTPEEVEDFKIFIKDRAPFDVIIDGLNVLYISGIRVDQSIKYRKLLSLIQQLKEENKKVLLIGRKHMENGLRNINVSKYCHLYLVNNDSEDDPFMIYSSLMSGPDCYVATRDFLRNHMFNLKDPELKEFFVRWRKTRQLKNFVIENDKICYLPPVKEDRVAQFSENLESVHIPYEDGKARPIIDPPKTWLCAKRITS